MKFLKRCGYLLLFLFILFNAIGAIHAWKFTHFYDDVNHVNKKPEQMTTGEKVAMILTGVKISKSVDTDTPTLEHENVILHTRDGIRLEGWYIPSDKAPNGTVILLHGYGSSRSDKLPEANYFHQLGYNTFLIDFRAHGGSGGHACSIGYKETEDLLAAWRFVKNKGENDNRITLWGMSMGAAVILKGVPEFDLHPGCVILEAPFASLTDAVNSRMRSVHIPNYPFTPLLTFWGGIEQGFWGFDFEPYRYAEKITCPALMCWGRHDPRVMEFETQKIFTHLGVKAPNKSLVIFEHSGHQSFCRNEGDKWKAGIKDFMATPE